MASSIFEESHQHLVAVLIAARKRTGLTQAQIGKRVGRSQSFMSSIERGQRRVDVLEFIALSKAMEQDAQTLFELVLTHE